MKQLLLGILTAIITLLLSSCVLIIFLAHSNFGTRLLVKSVEKIIPGQLHITHIEGQLAQQIELDGISYDYQHNHFTVQRVKLNWQPQRLFKRELLIDALNISGLHILQWQNSPNTETKPLSFAFLRQITIQYFRIQDLQIIPWQKPITGQKIFLPMQPAPIQLEGALLWKTPESLLTEMRFQMRDATLTLYVAHVATWETLWKLAIPDLSKILLQSKGAIYSRGYWIGHKERLPELQQMTLTIQHLKMPNLNIRQFNAQGNLNSTQQGKLDIQASTIQFEKNTIQHLKLALLSTPQLQQLMWQIRLQNQQIQGKITGTWHHTYWQGQLQRADIWQSTVGLWRLQSPALLKISRNYFSLTHAKWQGNQGNLQTTIEWRPENYRLEATGKFPLPALGITVSPLAITLAGNSTQCDYQGYFVSGQGKLNFTGRAIFKPALQAEINLQGTNFLAVNIPHYQVWASPQLKLIYQAEKIALSGKLEIPTANISQPDFAQQTVTLPTDVIFIDQKPEHNNKTVWLENLQANILLTLGNKVHVALEGLDAWFNGALQIQQLPQRPATATGLLTLTRGTYKAYGEKLKIKNGQLLFNHSLVENPALQINAVKTVKILNAASLTTPLTTSALLPGITGTSTVSPRLTPNFNQTQSVQIGVNVTGTLQNPQFNLFSSPAILSQADILSYLLFDHPADQLSLADARFLLQASSSLQLPGNEIEQITRDIQNVLGLDEFKIGSTSYVDPNKGTLQQDTTLLLGKALSPRLYISYSQGLASSLNIFTVSYLLSSRWSVQATNGSLGNGVDLIYTLQRD